MRPTQAVRIAHALRVLVRQELKDAIIDYPGRGGAVTNEATREADVELASALADAFPQIEELDK